MRYNSNIEFSDNLGELATNEYYALMVTDEPRYKDTRKFFDKSRQWLGFECTSENRIYISKASRSWSYPGRGIMLKVIVNNPNLCVLITHNS